MGGSTTMLQGRLSVYEVAIAVHLHVTRSDKRHLIKNCSFVFAEGERIHLTVRQCGVYINCLAVRSLHKLSGSTVSA